MGVGSQTVTQDCKPDGDFVGAIPVNLDPLTTGSSAAVAPDGFFCPGQTALGAFGLQDTRVITQSGTPAGDVSGGSVQSGIVASVFCIPPTGNILIDGSADLPGPGSTSLPGTFELIPLS